MAPEPFFSLAQLIFVIICLVVIVSIPINLKKTAKSLDAIEATLQVIARDISGSALRVENRLGDIELELSRSTKAASRTASGFEAFKEDLSFMAENVHNIRLRVASMMDDTSSHASEQPPSPAPPSTPTAPSNPEMWTGW